MGCVWCDVKALSIS